MGISFFVLFFTMFSYTMKQIDIAIKELCIRSDKQNEKKLREQFTKRTEDLDLKWTKAVI